MLVDPTGPEFKVEDSLGSKSAQEIEAYLSETVEHNQTGYLNNDFRTCLSQLMNLGMESHPRGTTTKELLNYNITLKSARNRVITFADRKVNTKYLLGEFIWYLSGSNRPEGILHYSKFWDNIRNSGEMKGYDEGTINSNYGHRLFGDNKDLLVPRLDKALTPAGIEEDGTVSILPHETTYATGVSQWDSTISLLKKDKDTRQAIMNIHIPSDRHAGNADVPCTLSLHFFIREEKLHLIVNMRSNDVILGFTNDVFQFTMLQECLMMELRSTYPELEIGHYFHNAGSMHIYDRHFEMAEKIIATENAYDLEMIPMDVFNKDILNALVQFEVDWATVGYAEDFLDYCDTPAWNVLTPYWRTLIAALFFQDEEAMHALFGQEDDN